MQTHRINLPSFHLFPSGNVSFNTSDLEPISIWRINRRFQGSICWNIENSSMVNVYIAFTHKVSYFVPMRWWDIFCEPYIGCTPHIVGSLERSTTHSNVWHGSFTMAIRSIATIHPLSRPNWLERIFNTKYSNKRLPNGQERKVDIVARPLLRTTFFIVRNCFVRPRTAPQTNCEWSSALLHLMKRLFFETSKRETI